MLNYKHGFHAGNHADVLKHFCLIYFVKSIKKPYNSILYFDFAEPTSTFDDLSGNGNHGTLQGGAQIPSTTNDGISLSAADLTVQAPGGTSQTIPYTSEAQTINFSSLGITVNSSNVSDMTADLLVNAETFTVNPTLEVTSPVGSAVDAGYTFASTSVEFDDSLSTDLGLEIQISA